MLTAKNSSNISIEVVLEFVKKKARQSIENISMLSFEFQVFHLIYANVMQIWNRYAANRFGFKNPYEYLIKLVPGRIKEMFSPPPNAVIKITLIIDTVVIVSTALDICFRLIGGIASRKNHK